MDLRGDPYTADQYELLLRVLHKALIGPPKIAPRKGGLSDAATADLMAAKVDQTLRRFTHPDAKVSIDTLVE